MVKAVHLVPTIILYFAVFLSMCLHDGYAEQHGSRFLCALPVSGNKLSAIYLVKCFVSSMYVII